MISTHLRRTQVVDGLKALYYIAYYNLIRPWLPAGRAYIREANRSLEDTASPMANEALHHLTINRRSP